MKKDGIKVDGHDGTWYVIDEMEKNGKSYRLLEHEQHGDEALCVAIDEDGRLILEDISDGVTELSLYLDNHSKQWDIKCPICDKVHGKTAREHTQVALMDDSYMLDDDSSILILCNDCEALYQRPAVENL